MKIFRKVFYAVCIMACFMTLVACGDSVKDEWKLVKKGYNYNIAGVMTSVHKLENNAISLDSVQNAGEIVLLPTDVDGEYILSGITLYSKQDIKEGTISQHNFQVSNGGNNYINSELKIYSSIGKTNGEPQNYSSLFISHTNPVKEGTTSDLSHLDMKININQNISIKFNYSNSDNEAKEFELTIVASDIKK